MTFLHPWILLLLPVYLLAEALIYLLTRKRMSLAVSTLSFVPAHRTWRTKMLRFLRWFPVLAAVFLVIALSRPQMAQKHRQELPSGVDIMVVLDVSGSMAAEDFQPLNRLEVAKDVLRDFIRGRPSDRIGLVLFGGASVTRSPLTLQHQPLIRTLERIQLGSLPEGTAIGGAIMSGINRLTPDLKKAPSDQEATQDGDRILLLITDGRNNAGQIHPRDALEIALQQRIKIYTIGVGSFGEAPFPVYAADGKKAYRYEKADLDEALLQEIAERTGARYFRASDPQSLQQLFQVINRLEKSEPQVMESTIISDYSFFWAYPALILLVCYLMLTILIVRYP